MSYDLIRMFHIRVLQRSALPFSQKFSYFVTFSHVYSSSKHLVTRRVPSLQTLPSASNRIGWMSFSEGNRTADNNHIGDEISPQLYEKLSGETLENLCEIVDQLFEEKYPHEFDVSLSNGVLTVQLEHHGTYVINKQTPNRQIWLSSPTSGPKRYDCLNGHWIYSHDKTSLGDLLNREFSEILKQSVKITLPTL